MDRGISRTRGLRRAAVVLLCAGLVSGAGRQSAAQRAADGIASRLTCGEQPLTDLPLTAPVAADLRALYGRALEPIWTTSDGRPTADALAAIHVIRHADADGLDPEAYGATPIEFAAGWLAVGDPNTGRALDFDVALSAGLLSYLRDLHGGRVDPRRLGYAIPPRPFDAVGPLRAAIVHHDMDHLAAVAQPNLVLYRSLRTALVRYRALARNPVVSSLPAVVPARRPVSAADLATIQRLLMALGDAAPGSAPDGPADPDLVAAVTRFQERHGLSPDGVIGPATLAALRVPLADRVGQIELALERLRWLPPVDRGRFIAINIPMFRLWAWNEGHEDGRPAFSMNVIVGRAVQTKTPVLLDAVHAVMFRPAWNVPLSIVRHEILPALAARPGYLDAQRMVIVTPAGTAAAASPADEQTRADLAAGRLGLRQLPGPANSLGLIKFVLSNDEDIYLHDTPAPDLFVRTRRDFSHGCIRVQDPERLAAWLLESPDWDETHVRAAAESDATRVMPLERPVPLILFYMTAVVMPEDGTVHFAADIYGYDVRLQRALSAVNGAWSQ